MNRTRKLRIAWMAMIVILMAMAAYVAAGDSDLVGVAVVSSFVILLLNRVLAWQELCAKLVFGVIEEGGVPSGGASDSDRLGPGTGEGAEGP